MKNGKEIKISYESLQTEKKLKPRIEKILKKFKPYILENLKDYPIIVILKKSPENLVAPESEFEDVIGITTDTQGVIRFNKNSRCFIIEIKKSLLENKNKEYVERTIAEALLYVYVTVDNWKLGIPFDVTGLLDRADVIQELIIHNFISDEEVEEEILAHIEEAMEGGIVSEEDLIDYVKHYTGYIDESKIKELIKKIRAERLGTN